MSRTNILLNLLLIFWTVVFDIFFCNIILKYNVYEIVLLNYELMKKVIDNDDFIFHV